MKYQDIQSALNTMVDYIKVPEKYFIDYEQKLREQNFKHARLSREATKLHNFLILDNEIYSTTGYLPLRQNQIMMMSDSDTEFISRPITASLRVTPIIRYMFTDRKSRYATRGYKYCDSATEKLTDIENIIYEYTTKYLAGSESDKAYARSNNSGVQMEMSLAEEGYVAKALLKIFDIPSDQRIAASIKTQALKEYPEVNPDDMESSELFNITVEKFLIHFYLLALIVESCKTKKMNENFVSISAPEFARSLNLDVYTVNKYFSELEEASLIVKNFAGNARLILSDEDLEKVRAEISSSRTNITETVKYIDKIGGSVDEDTEKQIAGGAYAIISEARSIQESVDALYGHMQKMSMIFAKLPDEFEKLKIKDRMITEQLAEAQDDADDLRRNSIKINDLERKISSLEHELAEKNEALNKVRSDIESFAEERTNNAKRDFNRYQKDILDIVSRIGDTKQYNQIKSLFEKMQDKVVGKQDLSDFIYKLPGYDNEK